MVFSEVLLVITLSKWAVSLLRLTMVNLNASLTFIGGILVCSKASCARARISLTDSRIALAVDPVSLATSCFLPGTTW
jgi:hypothetical protein